MRVFVAGATGVLGRALLPVLVAAGHEVVGTTRSPSRAASIEATGARARVCDALDGDAVRRAVAESRPEVVVHHLTALPDTFAALRRGSEPTNRLRRTGTRNLVDAARAAGARRIVAESIAFLYSPRRSGPATEDEPMWTAAPRPYDSMIAALGELEHAVTTAPDIEGVVLRYGTLYGPGTFYASDGDIPNRLRKRRLPIVGAGTGVTSFVHVDDAATATAAALTLGEPGGVYNVTDDEPVTFHELLPTLAALIGARPPMRVPAWLARPLGGALGVAVMTAQRGATSGRARRELGWRPRYPSWRDGFATEFGRG